MEMLNVKCSCGSDEVEVFSKHEYESPFLIELYTKCSICKKEEFLKFATERSYDLEVRYSEVLKELARGNDSRREDLVNLEQELRDEMNELLKFTL